MPIYLDFDHNYIRNNEIKKNKKALNLSKEEDQETS